MSNKKNLNEATVRRFWKLAGLRPINESPFYIQEEEVENNEANRMKLVRAIGEGLPDDQKPGFFKSENKRMKFDDAYFQKQYAAYKEDFEHLEEVASKEEVDEMKAPQGSGIRGVYSDKSDDDDHEPTTKKVGTKGSTVTTAKARKMNEEDLEEMAKMKRDDLEEQVEGQDDMGEMETAPEDESELDGGDLEIGDVDADVDAEVSVPESDVEALRTARGVIDQILSAADGATAGDEMDPEAEIEDEEAGLLDDEPEMGMDEEPTEFNEEALEEMIESITAKVAKRLVKEALVRKLTK